MCVHNLLHFFCSADRKTFATHTALCIEDRHDPCPSLSRARLYKRLVRLPSLLLSGRPSASRRTRVECNNNPTCHSRSPDSPESRKHCCQNIPWQHDGTRAVLCSGGKLLKRATVFTKPLRGSRMCVMFRVWSLLNMLLGSKNHA